MKGDDGVPRLFVWLRMGSAYSDSTYENSRLSDYLYPLGLVFAFHKARCRISRLSAARVLSSSIGLCSPCFHVEKLLGFSLKSSGPVY